MDDTLAWSVLDVARDLLGDLDPELVLSRVVDSAREVTGARYGALGVVDESRTRLARFITSGLDEGERREIGAPPTGRGVLGELISNPVPLRLRDIGMHPRSYGFPIGHPPMRSFLGVPIMIRGEAFGNLYLTEKQDGDEFSVEDEEAAVLLAEFAALAIDHAQRFSGSEARREDLQSTVAALNATLQIARALGGQTELQGVLELIAKRGRALVSARTLVIEQIRGDRLVLAAGAGELPEGLVGREVDLADSAASGAIRTQLPQRLEDGPNRKRFERYGIGALGVEAEAGLVVPLLFRGQALGALVAVDRAVDGPCFTAQDEVLLEAFAVSAATAVATAHTVAAEHRRQRLAAAEDERGRWARELHDETYQSLAAIRLRLSGAQHTGTPEAFAAAVAETIAQVDSDIAALRSLITELRPAALDELGVGPAIEALATRVRECGLAVEIAVDPDLEAQRAEMRLSPDLETAVYRITQEALTNAQKHAQATKASVEIREADGLVTVVVRDDGTGFDTAACSNGFGLAGMGERAELVNGFLEIRSAPGAGTTVTARLPAMRTDEVAKPPQQALRSA